MDRFFQIENIVYFDNVQSSDNKNAFVLGRTLGTKSAVPYTPASSNGHEFQNILGQTTRLEGKAENLEAYPIANIIRKCVVSGCNAFTDTTVATSLTNTLESD